MPKTNKPERPPKKATPQSSPPPAKEKGMLQALSSSAWGIIVFVFAAIGVIATLYKSAETARSIYRGTIPEIASVGSDVSNPFALPFAVINTGEWLAMKDVKWSCLVEELTGPLTMTNVEMASGSTGSIAPKDQQNYSCSIAGLPSTAVRSLKIVLSVSYKMLWFDRKMSTPFSWQANRWVKGRTVF